MIRSRPSSKALEEEEGGRRVPRRRGAGGGASQEVARRSRKWSVSNLLSPRATTSDESLQASPRSQLLSSSSPATPREQGGASGERDKQLDILVNICVAMEERALLASQTVLNQRTSITTGSRGRQEGAPAASSIREEAQENAAAAAAAAQEAGGSGGSGSGLLVVDGVLSMKPGSSTKPSSGAAGSSSSNNNGGAGGSTSGGGSGGMEEKADMPTRSWCDASGSDLSKMLRTSMAEDVETFIQFTGANKQTAIAHVQEGVNNGVSIDEIIGRIL